MRKKTAEQQDLETELTLAKIRNINAQADKTEFKTSIARGEYVSVEQVKKLWAKNVLNTKQKLLALPTKAAPQLYGKERGEIHELLTEMVSEALTEMAEYDAGRIL